MGGGMRCLGAVSGRRALGLVCFPQPKVGDIAGTTTGTCRVRREGRGVSSGRHIWGVSGRASSLLSNAVACIREHVPTRVAFKYPYEIET